jgi:hypothetical protein
MTVRRFKKKMQDRPVKRINLVGADAVRRQDDRRRSAESKGPKAVTLDVQKRMKEYKSGNVIDKVKRYKNPLNK